MQKRFTQPIFLIEPKDSDLGALFSREVENFQKSSSRGRVDKTRGPIKQRPWVLIPPRSWLEGSQCHPPPQGATGYGKRDDISLSPTE